MNAQSFIDCPSRHWAGRFGHPIRYIVVHSTASPPGDPWETLHYLELNDRGVSYHELALLGYVYRMVTDERAAQHCWSKSVQFPGGEHYDLANCITLGVSGYQVVGEPTAPVVAAIMVARVAAACFRFGLDQTKVLGHREIDPTRKSDPVGVDMDWFRSLVQHALFKNQHVPERFYDCQV